VLELFFRSLKFAVFSASVAGRFKSKGDFGGETM
jgi:hypothetical protein